MIKSIILGLLLISFVGCKNQNPQADETAQKTEVKQEPTKPEATEIWEPKPKTISFNENKIPSDAIMLFDGKNLNKWVSAIDSTAAKWTINKDGSITVNNRTGDIQTKQNFGDVQLHVEWRSPVPVKAEGQHRANSGVYLQNRYELQVLDNNDNDTYVNGQVGSLYKQSIPLAKASVPSGQWNTYDIIYHAPEFDASGVKTKSANITVLHNGVLIQDYFELLGTTEYIGWPKNIAHGDAPIKLQDHGDNSGVSYRNIWVREL